MRSPAVPRFTDAEIQAEADLKWHGHDDKVSTTPATFLEIGSVGIRSRYNKADEFDSMAGMVMGLDERHRRLIESIWCDSKMTACYSVKLKPCTLRQARHIAILLEQDCCTHDGGHNGIHVEREDEGDLVLDPYWSGDFGNWPEDFDPPPLLH